MDQVVELGRAAVGPVLDVVRVQESPRPAPGEAAAAVARVERAPKRGRDGSRLAPDRERLPVAFEQGVPRVYTVLKLDERRDREQTLDDKVASVRRLLDN